MLPCSSGYKIPGRNVKNKEVGTLEKPYLVAITSGERSGKPLCFHVKIGRDYHKLRVHDVGSKYAYLSCGELSCNGRHKSSLRPDLIKCEKMQ